MTGHDNLSGVENYYVLTDINFTVVVWKLLNHQIKFHINISTHVIFKVNSVNVDDLQEKNGEYLFNATGFACFFGNKSLTYLIITIMMMVLQWPYPLTLTMAE